MCEKCIEETWRSDEKQYCGYCGEQLKKECVCNAAYKYFYNAKDKAARSGGITHITCGFYCPIHGHKFA